MTKRSVWTGFRDDRLRRMYESGSTIAEIADGFANVMGEASIRRRIMFLQLRRDPLPPAPVMIAPPVPRADAKRRLPVDWPRPNELPIPPRSGPRIIPDETPCPYYNPLEKRGEPCGATVNRRHDRNGNRPGPYCRRHSEAVKPIAKSMMGAG